LWYPSAVVTHMGKRTSVYLSTDLAAAVDETGLALAELVRRGVCASLANRVVVPAAGGAVVPADAPLNRHCEQCGALIGRVPR
jgi:hypothetical protein